jgi:uncharacterized RmlC-like cupin family protein
MMVKDATSHAVLEREEHEIYCVRGNAGLAFAGKLSRTIEVRQGDQAERNNNVILSIRDRLEEHPHFRGRASQLQIEVIGDAVVLSGRLPTYYLKQLLQEAVKKIPDVIRIDNRVEVASH